MSGCAISDAHGVVAAASTEGFGWRSVAPAQAKLVEAVEELRAAVGSGSQVATREELGDVLFAVVGLAYWLGVEPADALRASTKKFGLRLRIVRALAGPGGLSEASVDELVALWQQAKCAVDKIARGDQGHR